MADTPREPCQEEQNAPSGEQRSPSLVITLTCPAPPPGGAAEKGQTGGRVRRPSVVTARCVRPSLVPSWRGGWRWIPCGRPRCSWQCRNVWARKMSAALRRSFRVLPPTHFVRVTVLDMVSAEELTRRVGRFLRRLRRRGCEYFALNEWREGVRHHHVLARTEGELTSAVVAQLWRDSCGGARVTSYCRPVRSAEASCRYVLKDVRDPSKKEVPPVQFKGRLFSNSSGFLAAPLKTLMRAVVKEWREQVQSRTRSDQRGDSSERLTTKLEDFSL